MEFAATALRDDSEVVMAALGAGGYGDAWRFASRRLRDDAGLAFAAVAWHGAPLAHASRRLRGDRAFLLRVAAHGTWK